MKLGIYIRVSTDEQSSKGISLRTQEARGVELAKKLGLEYEVFSDAGLSGTLSFEKRPALNKLLTLVSDGKISVVFVSDLDRLSRGGIIQTTLIKNLLKEKKVKLYDINSEIDLNDINQELLSDIRSLLAAFEIKKTSSRIKETLKDNAKIGKVGGGPMLPYGYTKDSEKKLVIEPNEAKTIKLIFELALEGKGTKVIAKILNEKKIPTKRGLVKKNYSMKVRGVVQEKFEWRDAVVYRILTGSMYAGKRLYKGEYYPCPAIINETTFNLVQQKLKSRNQFKDTRNTYKYLLKGLLHCAICKGRMYGHKRANGKDNAYICISKRYGKFCGNVGINIDYLENLVVENILSLDKQANKYFDRIKEDPAHKSTQHHIGIYQKKIDENKKAIENLLDVAQKGNIDPEMFRNRILSLNKVIDEAKEKVRMMEKNTGILKDEKNVVELVKTSIAEFRKNKDFQFRVNFIRNFISGIYIRYEVDELAHLISINYKINNLSDYYLSKEIVVNRTGVDADKKRKVKILREEIRITSVPNPGHGPITWVKYDK